MHYWWCPEECVDCAQQQAEGQPEWTIMRLQAQKLMVGVRADLLQEKHAEGVHSLEYLGYLAQLLIETHNCFHLIPVHHTLTLTPLNIICVLCMFWHECQ